MISYIVKFTICSGILIAVYHLFLEREKMLRFNRFYLLSAILFSIGIPLVSIEMANEPVSQAFGIVPAGLVQNNLSTMISANEPVLNPGNEFPDYLPWLAYSLICLILLGRFTINIIAILRQKAKCKVVRQGNVKLVLVPGDITSYTFLNNIFISAEPFENGHFKDEILTHEKAHATQKHSLDIIFIELIGTLLWFNPFLFFYKKAIRLNHEYLADEAVLVTFSNVKNYQLLLLDTILHKQDLTLSSSFNYSITKKRLAMMTKIKNVTRQYAKQGIIALLTIALGFVFSERIYSQGEKSAKKSLEVKAIPIEPENREGISEDKMREFKETINSHTHLVKDIKGRIGRDVRIEPKLKEHLYRLYTQMSREQQNTVRDSGILLAMTPIPVKKAPTREIFENWKKPEIFGVWLDGRHIPNKNLDKLKNTDIAEYNLSKLYGAALKGRSYKYQLDLNTNQNFDENFEARVSDRVIIYLIDGFAKKK